MTKKYKYNQWEHLQCNEREKSKSEEKEVAPVFTKMAFDLLLR